MNSSSAYLQHCAPQSGLKKRLGLIETVLLWRKKTAEFCKQPRCNHVRYARGILSSYVTDVRNSRQRARALGMRDSV